MYITTHFMVPVLIARQENLRKLRQQVPKTFSTPQVFLIGLAGILPDILSPHIWLNERHQSYSHTLLAFIAFSLLSLLFTLKKPKFFFMLSSAYALHLFFDYISGGIPLLLPFKNDIYVQFYLLPPIHWVITDIVLFLALYWQSWHSRFRLKKSK